MGLYRGGRPKGTKNKKTDLFAKCDLHNVDVFEECLIIAMNEALPDKRFSKFMKLADFLYAKPKDDGERALTADDLRAELKLLKSGGNSGDAG